MVVKNLISLTRTRSSWPSDLIFCRPWPMAKGYISWKFQVSRPISSRDIAIQSLGRRFSNFKVTPKVNGERYQKKRCSAFCMSPLAVIQRKLHSNIFRMFWDELIQRFSDLDLLLSRSLKPLKVLLLYPIEQPIGHSPYRPWFIWGPNFGLRGPQSGGTN